jgi:hypothetical protein
VSEALFGGGPAIDLVLAVFAVEAAVLLLLRRRTGLSSGDVLGLLGAGFLLTLAVRAALSGAPAAVTGGLLLASFPLHLWDLSRRVALARRARGAGPAASDERRGRG